MTAPTVWACKIQSPATLIVRERDAFENYLRLNAGDGNWEMILRKQLDQRSLDQNAYWWAEPVPRVAAAMGDDLKSAHYAMLEECWGSHFNEPLQKWIPNKGSSSALTTPEFSYMIEWCPTWAYHKFNGLVIRLPNEVFVE